MPNVPKLSPVAFFDRKFVQAGGYLPEFRGHSASAARHLVCPGTAFWRFSISGKLVDLVCPRNSEGAVIAKTCSQTGDVTPGGSAQLARDVGKQKQTAFLRHREMQILH